MHAGEPLTTLAFTESALAVEMIGATSYFARLAAVLRAL